MILRRTGISPTNFNECPLGNVSLRRSKRYDDSRKMPPTPSILFHQGLNRPQLRYFPSSAPKLNFQDRLDLLLTHPFLNVDLGIFIYYSLTHAFGTGFNLVVLLSSCSCSLASISPCTSISIATLLPSHEPIYHEARCPRISYRRCCCLCPCQASRYPNQRQGVRRRIGSPRATWILRSSWFGCRRQ